MGTNNSKEIIENAINEQRKDQLKEYLSRVFDITNYKSKCQKPHQPVLEVVYYADFDSKPVRENTLVRETVLKKMIRGRDGRKRVNETRNWPKCVHGALRMIFETGESTGSATMIGPNIAITAAHCLYNLETKIEVKVSDVFFHPAADDRLLPFGIIKVLAFYYPEEYKTTGKEDYALLILQQDIGYQTGFFGVHAMESQELQSKKINITGYPSDKVKDKPKHHQMWGMDGPICKVSNDLIFYEIDTYGGQSGSGIWYDAGGEYYIVGVHIAGCESTKDYNQGTFINKKRLERIRGWVCSFYFQSEYAQHLQSLDLSGKDIGKREAEYLSQANLLHLISLNLFSNNIGDQGAECLSRANLLKLQSLNLSSNNIGEKGAEYLSKSNFPQLQLLHLATNQIADPGTDYLSRANLPQLQSLNLSSNQIGDQGAKSLSQANFTQLQSLNLYDNQIGEKGAEYLSKSGFIQLQSLNLSSNNIGDKGTEYLSKAKFLQLQFLYLSWDNIGNKGAEYLSNASFPQLQSLHLSGNQIGKKGADFLQLMISRHSNPSRMKIIY